MTCRSEHAPGGAPTMVVNDDAGSLIPRGVFEGIASRARSYRSMQAWTLAPLQQTAQGEDGGDAEARPTANRDGAATDAEDQKDGVCCRRLR
jgi:hypothetical protein